MEVLAMALTKASSFISSARDKSGKRLMARLEMNLVHQRHGSVLRCRHPV